MVGKHRTQAELSRSNTCPSLNVFIRSKDIRRRSLKSFEIGPNFACFWPIKYFWLSPPSKFWTGIIKFGPLLIILQNFAAIGGRSLEISR